MKKTKNPQKIPNELKTKDGKVEIKKYLKKGLTNGK